MTEDGPGEPDIPEQTNQPVADELTELTDQSIANPEPTPPTVDIDPEVLSALGEPTSDTPVFGPAIHENLAQRWLPILKKGLPKELKDKLLKELIVPENCTLLQAPKLNAEIAAAITDMSRNRDKKIEAQQQQLGAGITAVNRAMSLLITSEDKIQAIKYLSDSCRILSDLHFNDSQTRIKMLTPSLDKGFLSVVKDSERDETLFGDKLSEKIKASKVIEKQGLQIKNRPPSKVPAPPQSITPRPARYQENWTAPPRYPYPLNRGGRGGFRRPTPTPQTNYRRMQSTVNKGPTQNKLRSQTQH